MNKPIQTTPATLRRLILAQQGLLRWRGGRGRWAEGVPWLDQPASTLEAIKRLEAVQLDPVAVVERNHHLVLWNRVKNYQPKMLEALYPQKRVFEYWAQARCILPLEDWGIFGWRRERWGLERTIEGMMVHNRHEGYAREVTEAVEYIRLRLAQEGSLPARALDTGKRVRGYWGFTAKASSQAVEHLWEAGEIVVSERRGEERFYALASSWLPATPGQEKAKDHATLLRDKLVKFIRAYGVVDASDPRLGWRNWPPGERKAELEALLKSEAITPLEIQGLPSKRRYFLWGELAEMLEGIAPAKVSPRVWFLPPLDNLLWRRERIVDLFGFDYKWEIYVPEHKRKYGPYILPILEGERFVGRLDARMNRAEGRLEVRRIFWETPPDECRVARVHKALERFGSRLGVTVRLP